MSPRLSEQLICWTTLEWINALQFTPVVVILWVTVIILVVVLFVFEDVLVELVLGAGKELTVLIGLLEVLGVLIVSFFAARRAFRIGQRHL
ncbi:MAG: hypothetical protein ACXVI3_05455 [Halobacteriota archaeon]